MDALALELAEHRQWKLRPEFASLRVFDHLLENEFRPVAEQQEQLAARVRSMVGYAIDQAPYYARMFDRLGLRPSDIEGPEDLAKLPALTKHDLIESHYDLRARFLPPNEKAGGRTQSSGTTGRRVTVFHSSGSNAMFHFLRHRNARWHRMNPLLTRLDVRQRSDVFGGAQPPGNQRHVQYPSWRHLGRFFETGVEFGFAVSEPMEQHLTMLHELQPDYAMTFPGVFEEWLMANNWRNPARSLKALIGIGSQLTPSMRTKLEQSYGVPIHMSYGLNEIGMVAARCAEGRYHFHSEHCLVQIARADGSPCKTGEVGHVLVTGLRNYAMPLIRYDTGDLAEVVEGPCACGRTLPSFGELAGRYRRYAGLPEGSRERVRAIREAIENCAPDELAFLRRYQILQDKDNRFTLRLKTVAAIPEQFRNAVTKAWSPFSATASGPLAIVELDDIAAGPGGKLLDFISEFHADSSYASDFARGAHPLADN